MLNKILDSLFHRFVALSYVYIESQKIKKHTTPSVFYAEYLRTLEFIKSFKND